MRSSHNDQTTVKQVAVLDLGSNAARLAVFAYDPGREFRLIDELREPLRLTSESGSGNVIRG